MASVIFRPYWIDAVRTYAAVVGDISLDAVWRGRGLGQRLLRFMTDYLDDHFPENAALVIPTEAARRSLAEIGWTTPGRLVPYVCLLDPTRYLQTVLGTRSLAKRFASRIRGLETLIVRRFVHDRRMSLQVVDAPDARLARLLRTMRGPRGAAVHDLAPEVLTWRYSRHPRVRFRIATLMRGEEVAGLLVFEQNIATRTCSIYDLVATTPADLQCIVALFVLRALDDLSLATVRILLNDRHPHRSFLRHLGFIRRRSEAVFQIHSRSGIAERVSWALTSGDKDT